MGVLGMHDSQSQMFLECIEVSITMQQRMAFVQAKSCYEAIDSFANRVATLPK